MSGGCAFFGPPRRCGLTYDVGGGSRTTRNNKSLALAWLMLAVFCLTPGLVPMLRAQSVEHSSRKVIRSQKPDYPAILKNSRIGGTVRLNASVLANGTVANVQVPGRQSDSRRERSQSRDEMEIRPWR